MGMETIDRICCNCIHYAHGVLEDPCMKGKKNCGYLHDACWRFETEPGKEVAMPTKVCSVCGEELTIEHYYRKNNKYMDVCKKCHSHRDKAAERKKRREERRRLSADLNIGTKVCKNCGEELPLSEFYKSKGNKDGYEGCCKACRVAMRKK